jgi:hypothetical protein
MNWRSFVVKPPRSLVLQIIAQWTYIGLTLYFAALARPVKFYPVVLLFCLFIDGLYRYFATKRTQIILLNFSVIAIVNSVLANFEPYTFSAFFACSMLAMASKLFIHDAEGKHVYNPSAFGIVAAVVLFPSIASPSVLAWGDFWPWGTLAAAIPGAIATYSAGTIRIILGYFLSFALMSVGAHYLFPEAVQVFFWPSTLLSIGSVIFIFGVISDPRTSPQNAKNQWLFGITIAAVDLFLRRHSILIAELLAYLAAQSIRAFVRDWRLKRVDKLVQNIFRNRIFDAILRYR